MHTEAHVYRGTPVFLDFSKDRKCQKKNQDPRCRKHSTPAQTGPTTKGRLVYGLPTHLHESPVVVHLLGRLEKVAPVSPHGRMLLCDNGCA